MLGASNLTTIHFGVGGDAGHASPDPSDLAFAIDSDSYLRSGASFPPCLVPLHVGTESLLQCLLAFEQEAGKVSQLYDACPIILCNWSL